MKDSNLLEVIITRKPGLRDTGLNIRIHKGIMLDKGKDSLCVGNKWVVNDPKYGKDPVISEDGQRLIGAAFFQNNWKAYISAPLPPGMQGDKYVHSEDREVLIDVRVDIKNIIFIRDIFDKTEEVEGRGFLDRKINPQLHDVDEDVSMILIRMRVGQIIRIFTKDDGIVSLCLEKNGSLCPVFGYRLPDHIVDMMEDAAEDRKACERQARAKYRDPSEEEQVEYSELRALPLKYAFSSVATTEPCVQQSTTGDENVSGKKVVPPASRRRRAPKC